MAEASITIGAFLAAFFLTGLVRRHALVAKLLDEPGSRRSHRVPTPRGGGLAIVAVILTGLPTLWLTGRISGDVFAALGIGGAAVAAVGWLDDHKDVPARWRLLVHLSAAAWAVWLAGVPEVPLPNGREWDWGMVGGAVMVLGIAWVLNLYNFMDGIDGIAGVEAVTTAGLAAVLLGYSGHPGWAMASVLVAAASLGFLLWNWPPAKIFMGDTGSGFLGFVLASLAVWTASEDALSVWVWAILLGVFIVDATFTLGRRALRAEPLHQAHRTHAYQYAARQFGSHLSVTRVVGLINVFWLGPLAWLATESPAWGGPLTFAAWAPLVGLCLVFGAGTREHSAPSTDTRHP